MVVACNTAPKKDVLPPPKTPKEALERRILSGLGIADPYRSGAGAGA